MTVLKDSPNGVPRCKSCGQQFAGRYTIALDAHWHPEHFVCKGCRRPLLDASFAVRNGNAYHAACSVALCPKCCCCGMTCSGQYLHDADKNIFCPACYDRTHCCQFCSRRLCAGQGCKVCGEPVPNVAEARVHMARMVEWVRRHGVPLRWKAENIDLRCVREVRAGGFLSPSSQHRLGLTTVSWTEQRTPHGLAREHTVTVQMKNTMPETIFRGVAAHELGHVWMMTEGIEKVEPDECEGICELLAFLYYKSLGSAEGERHARRIRDNPDTRYGGGFRKVLAIFERAGMTKICASLAQTGGLPRVTPP